MTNEITPAKIRNIVNEMEKELIDYAGTNKFSEKCEEIEQIKREANEEFGLMFII